MRHRINRKVVCFDRNGHIYLSVKADNDAQAKEIFLSLYEKEERVEILKERIDHERTTHVD